MPVAHRYTPAPTPFFNSAGLARTSTGGMEDVKEFLQKESLGVSGLKNWHVLAIAAVGGLAYYGHKEGWF